MGRLRRDTSNQAMQVFTPYRRQAVTSGSAWTPGDDDRVFVATEDVNCQINGGTAFPLQAYVPLGILEGYTYTFDANIALLVM